MNSLVMCYPIHVLHSRLCRVMTGCLVLVNYNARCATGVQRWNAMGPKWFQVTGGIDSNLFVPFAYYSIIRRIRENNLT